MITPEDLDEAHHKAILERLGGAEGANLFLRGERGASLSLEELVAWKIAKPQISRMVNEHLERQRRNQVKTSASLSPP